MAAMKSTCSIRELEKAEIENEDIEVLDDVGKDPAEKSEESLKILIQEVDEERFFLLKLSRRRRKRIGSLFESKH